MKLNEIKAPKGANRRRKRIGRGIGSGHGHTATKGHKGQLARAGGSVRPGFEGGQMPLQRRIPKFGFTNIFRKEYAEIKLLDLQNIEAEVIDVRVLIEAGLIRNGKDGVKILGNGEIGRAVTVRVDKITKSAREKIEAAGGKVELVEIPLRPVDVDVAAAGRMAGDVVDLETLKAAKLLPAEATEFRLVKRGPLKAAKTFKAKLISNAARQAILAAGGKIEEMA